MTKEEILAMKPGRELDRLVAKEVMRDKWLIASATVENGWAPSTSISAALEVVEKINKQYAVSINLDELGYTSIYLRLDHCIFHELENYVNMPEAICKVALLAVME